MTKKPSRGPMSPQEYIKLRERLKLSNYALRRVLGISLRQAQRYESGEAEIPDTIARLLWMFAKHGIPEKW